MTSVRCGPRGAWQPALADFVPSPSTHFVCSGQALRDLFPFFAPTRDFRPGLSYAAPSGLALGAWPEPIFADDAEPAFAVGSGVVFASKSDLAFGGHVAASAAVAVPPCLA